MQKFKEIFEIITEAPVEKLTDMTSVKQKMVDIISNYAPRSFTTYVVKAPRVIDYVFSGENAKEMSHNFVYQLYATKEQILVRDSVFEKYLKVIEYFGEKK